MRSNFLDRHLYFPLSTGNNSELISVNEAKEHVCKNVCVMHPVKLNIADAAGYVLAEDVFATADIPAFNQSSVDGYAFAFEDVSEGLTIDGEAAAGASGSFSISPKHTMRIFTGAAIPANADTVAMQEKATIEHEKLFIRDPMLQRGGNFRPKGSEIKAGTLALDKNNLLSPAAIGFLAGIGVTELTVYSKPSVSILVTGNELQQPGKILEFGQVYESNSYTLKAALQQLHIQDVNICWVKDDLASLTTKLNEALEASDMVLLTGGISAGDYDFVLKAATACGVEKIFHKVKQRPGKPLYFGRKENKIVFGLPGNPSSVLTCFYEYVIPALEIMTNRKNIIRVVQAAMAKGYKKLMELTFFLKGFYEAGKAMPFDAQESYRMSTYATANCLIRLEEGMQEYKEGDIVEIHLLPN